MKKIKLINRKNIIIMFVSTAFTISSISCVFIGGFLESRIQAQKITQQEINLFYDTVGIEKPDMFYNRHGCIGRTEKVDSIIQVQLNAEIFKYLEIMVIKERHRDLNRNETIFDYIKIKLGLLKISSNADDNDYIQHSVDIIQKIRDSSIAVNPCLSKELNYAK